MDGKSKILTTQEDKARIQSSQSKHSSDGNTPKDSFASRSQSAADKHTATTQEDKARIQSSQSKHSSDGNTPKDSFASRSQSAADKHTAAGRTNK